MNGFGEWECSSVISLLKDCILFWDWIIDILLATQRRWCVVGLATMEVVVVPLVDIWPEKCVGFVFTQKPKKVKKKCEMKPMSANFKPFMRLKLCEICSMPCILLYSRDTFLPSWGIYLVTWQNEVSNRNCAKFKELLMYVAVENKNLILSKEYPIICVSTFT